VIDRRHIGFATQPSSVIVDPWRVKLFCQAIGETDDIYWNAARAVAAGLPACPVPPTFLKSVEGEHFSTAALLELLQVPLRRVLHAEQSFEHLVETHVGDTVTVHRTIADIYDKKDGALTFIVIDTTYRVSERPIASSRQTIVVRNTLSTR
jgi:hypothetical protein